jgi:phospholipid-binding lipoprotein MlaA
MPLNAIVRMISIVSIAACTLMSATIYAATTTPPDPIDPYENYNRHAFEMNQKLDKVIFKPVATAYNTVLPWPAKKGISNFFGNLNMIPTVINDILQGNIRNTASDSWRFVINSTVGIFGLVDVAASIDLPDHSEDLGLTLAKWGYKDSHYLVLPIFGPSTVRDALALPVDYEVTSVYPYINPISLRYSLISLNFTSKRAQLLDYEDVINQASFDPYVFQRNAYLQRRAYLIQQNSQDQTDPYVDDHPVNMNIN